jgi:threonine dehydrogenase-like Zn-dependent dehydrogenase
VRVALQNVNPHGEVILLGSTRGKVELDVYKLIHRKYVSLIGAHENRYPKFAGTESQYGFGCAVIDALTTGTLKVEGFITDHIVPAQADQAYHWLLEDKDHHLGIVIHWQKEE